MPYHMPQGSGTGQIHFVPFPTFPGYFASPFPSATFFFGHGSSAGASQSQAEPFSGPFDNPHLNLMNSLQQQKKEGNQKSGGGGLPSFGPSMQSGESFGNHPAFSRSFNAHEIFGGKKPTGAFVEPQQSLSIEFRRG